MAQRKKQNNDIEDAVASYRPSIMSNNSVAPAFGPASASAVPGLTDIPVPAFGPTELSAMLRALPEKADASSQIPTGHGTPAPPVQESLTISEQLGRAWDSASSYFFDKPEPSVKVAHAPDAAQGDAAHRAGAAAHATSQLVSDGPSHEPATDKAANHAHVKKAGPARAAASHEAEPAVVEKPDYSEVVKSMDPLAVVERAQGSERSLDDAQRLAFALRQIEAGKETVAEALSRVEQQSGKSASEGLKGSLESAGLFAKEGAPSLSPDALRSISAAADKLVLDTFKDFREQRSLAEALPPEVYAQAKQTLADQATAQGEASKEVHASATEATPRDKEIQAATEFLQAKAEAAGIGKDSVDAITAAELLAVVKEAPADAVVRLDGEGPDGSAKSASFTPSEMLQAVSEAQAGRSQQQETDRSSEGPVQTAQAEMEMGD